MDDKKLMSITQGVPYPWFVKSVELNTSEERIDVYSDFIKVSEFAYPICNKPCTGTIYTFCDSCKHWKYAVRPGNPYTVKYNVALPPGARVELAKLYSDFE